MSDLEILAIGNPFPGSGGALAEGCHYSYDASGHWVHYFYDRPSPAEISSIQTGEAYFGLHVRESVLFLLHRFGQMLWNDSSYNWWLVSENARQIPSVGDGMHALLKVVLVDTASGAVAALRALTFSAEFTDRLHHVILAQIRQPLTKEGHELAVRYVYGKHSTLDLVARAELFCKGGE